jgi:P-type E1-E2 ATPase
MLSITIPGIGKIELENAVFDLNGTLAVDGVIPDDVKKKLNELAKKLNVFLLTADTYGNAEKVVSDLSCQVVKISPDNEAEQKRDFVQSIGEEKTVAIGNGANDMLMLKIAKIGIAVLEREGAFSGTINNADVVVHGSKEAIDLLLSPKRIISTLRR